MQNNNPEPEYEASNVILILQSIVLLKGKDNRGPCNLLISSQRGSTYMAQMTRRDKSVLEVNRH